MKPERLTRSLHIAATVHFALGASIVLVWSLLDSNLNWWAVFSLSAQGSLLLALGALIYGFAVFSGAVGERIETEHPFTSTVYYRMFYLILPVLAGIMAGIDFALSDGPAEGVRGWALGVVFSAIFIWLFVDPVFGVVESALPQSRRLRRKRKERERALRTAHMDARTQRLRKIDSDRENRLSRIAGLVEESARRLIELLNDSSGDPARHMDEGGIIGLRIWQRGGLECMQEVRRKTADICMERKRPHLMENLDCWWDGIGPWRRAKTANSV